MVARGGKPAFLEDRPEAGRTHAALKIGDCTISRTISANITIGATTSGGFALIAETSPKPVFLEGVEDFQNAVALVQNFRNGGKSQVLVSMLQQPKIHPLLAFQHSGLFVDPERAYTLSMNYYEEQQMAAQNNPNNLGNPNGSEEDE